MQLKLRGSQGDPVGLVTRLVLGCGRLRAAEPRRAAWIALPVACLLLGGVAQAEVRVESERFEGGGLASVPESLRLAHVAPEVQITLPAVSAAERELRLGGLAQRSPRYRSIDIGFGRELTAAQSADLGAERLVWLVVPDGSQVASLSVRSPGAAALRMQLRFDAVPGGTELRFFDPADPGTVLGPVVRPGDDEAPFWSPAVDGDTLAVEIELPPGASANALRFAVERLSHLDRSAGDLALAAGGCGVDPSSAPERLAPVAVASVALVQQANAQGGSAACTGTLLADGHSGSQIPYFLTANHCVPDAETAASVELLWFHDSPDGGSPDVVRQSGGAVLVAADADRDFSLLRLKSAPPAGVGMAGWSTRSLTAGDEVVAVHHPGGGPKTLGYGVFREFARPAAAAAYLDARVGYTLGGTLPGSSGSPLWRGPAESAVLMGVLTAGESSCVVPGGYDHYARFDQIFPYVQPWLYPQGGDGSGLDVALIDVATGSVVKPLESGWRIDRGRLPGRLALRVDLTEGFSGSVQAVLVARSGSGAGAGVHHFNAPPYIVPLPDDAAGGYRLTVTSFSGRNLDGAAGDPKTLPFSVRPATRVPRSVRAATRASRSVQPTVVKAASSTPAEGDLRLMRGNFEWEGGLEVFLNDEWGTVCDDFFGKVDADVACRQLGYSGADSILWDNSGLPGTGSIWMDNVACIGSESRLIDCRYNSAPNCYHFEDIAISCVPPSGADPDTAIDLGALTPANGSSTVAGSLSAADEADHYVFTLASAGRIALTLSGLVQEADLFLDDADGDEVFSSTNSGTTSESINELLAAGTWHVRVEARAAGDNDYVLGYGVTALAQGESLSTDAALTALSLTDVDFGSFASDTLSYFAAVEREVAVVTVSATAAAGAAVNIQPLDAEIGTAGHQVGLAEGAQVAVKLVVTAADRVTTRTYTVTVTRRGAARRITGFALVDATGLAPDEDITAIEEGAVLDLGQTAATSFSIRADVVPRSHVGSVRLELTGPVTATRVENRDGSPYALYGDDGRGNYWGAALPNGTYRIVATPYSGYFAGGTVLEATARNFTVTRTVSEGDSDDESGDDNPLTVSVSSFPETHSGVGTTFTGRVQFSEPVAVSYKVLRDEALEVTNGICRMFRRVDGRSDLWEVHVRVTSNDGVRLKLPATSDCDDAAAVCTGDEKVLSDGFDFTVDSQ